MLETVVKVGFSSIDVVDRWTSNELLYGPASFLFFQLIISRFSRFVWSSFDISEVESAHSGGAVLLVKILLSKDRGAVARLLGIFHSNIT